jgi:Kef-type K+ transport system membrane component KefB
MVAIFFLTLILSAYTTEVIGIHALFGAFMAGAIMPENTKFRTFLLIK